MIQGNFRVLITQRSRFYKVSYLRTFHILVHISLHNILFLIFLRTCLNTSKKQQKQKKGEDIEETQPG